MATIDSLDIQISAQVNKANASLTTLINRLDRVSASLSGVNSRGLATMGAGVNKLANAMSNFSANTKTADFSRLSKNLASISNIDTSKFSDISSKMSQLSSAFNSFGAVPENAQQIGEFARNISKLGNKGITNAINNIPQLAVAMRNLMQTLATAPVVSQNVIHMTNALANLASQGGKVGTASRTMVSGLNNTSNAMNRAKRSSLGLAAAFGKFYATWFLAIRGIKGFMKSVESTTDYIEAYNYYNVAFGKIASEWDKDFEKYGYQNAESYAESFTKRMNQTLGKLSGVQVNLETGLLEETGLRNLGLNIQEITQYASQLASVTNSIGQTGEVSLAAAKSMTMLAGDISSLFNIDFSDVAQNLQSGLIGQSRALYKYGIDITNATLQTYAYNLGLEKSVSEMTQAEKMQLRMLAILDQSKVSWGDLANTISSPSNMLRQFTNNVKELGMVFGQLFIPVLQKVMPVINGVTIALKRLMVNIAGFLGVKIDFDTFGQGYSNLGNDADDLADSLDGVGKSAKKAKAGLREFDELKVINMTDASTGGGGAGGGNAIDLTDEILKATEEYERVWNEAFAKMENTAQEWANRIEKYLEPVKKIFKDFAIGDFFQAGKDISALAKSILNFFTKAIKKVNWKKIGENIGKFFSGIDWVGILSSTGNLIWTALKSGLDVWAGAFDAAPIETGIITAIGLLKFTPLGGMLSNKINSVLAKISPNLRLPTLAGAIAAYAGEFLLIEDGFSRLISGSSEVYTALVEIAAGVGIAITALKLLGLLNPFTGILVALTGIAAAFIGVNEGLRKNKEELKNAKEIELFGDTLDNIGEKLANAAEETRNWTTASMEYVQGAGAGEAEFAQTLADRYFDLAEKQSLTNDERLEMIGLADQLVKTFPELEQYYNDETGLLDTTRESVDALIQSRLAEIQLSAIEDKLKEAYAQRIERLDELNEATENYQIALEELNRLQEKQHDLENLYDAIEAYEELQQQVFIGAENEEALIEATENLYQLLGEQGITEIPTLSEVTLQLNDASDAAWNFGESYVDALDQMQLAQSTYDEIQTSITDLTGMMTDTMVEQQRVLQETQEVMGETAEEAESTLDEISQKNEEATSSVSDSWDDTQRNVRTSASRMSNGVRDGANNVVRYCKDMQASAQQTDSAFSTAYGNIIKNTKDFLKNLKDSLKDLPSVQTGAVAGGMMLTYTPKQYAVGGFPEDGWFRASHGEIMGKFDNGQSVIANNQQITQGIADAVYPAVYNAIMSAMQNGGGSNVNIKVEADPSGIFKVTQKEAKDYYRRTGKPAYSF